MVEVAGIRIVNKWGDARIASDFALLSPAKANVFPEACHLKLRDWPVLIKRAFAGVQREKSRAIWH